MVFPEVLGSVNEDDIEHYLIKLTKRLIKDIKKQYAYVLENMHLLEERNALLVHYNEVRYDLQTQIFNIKLAMGRLAMENVIQPTLVLLVNELESVGYLVINPSLTFNSESLKMIIDKSMTIVYTNFMRIVDISENQELNGDNITRREVIALLNDILLLLERTKLHCPAINVYDEDVTINVSRMESIKQIKFSEVYHKMLFSEIIRNTISSLQDIVIQFHKSMYGYNQATRKFLKYCAQKINTEKVDFENHLANVVKSDDDEMYASVQGELLKLFTNCNSIYAWITDSSKGSNLKYEASPEAEESDQEEETSTPEEEAGARALEEVDEATLDEQRIIEALIFAKPHDTEEVSQKDELIKELKRNCTIEDINSKFDNIESPSYREIQRRLTSDYILLSRQFIREINVLFDFVNKICIKKLRFNKKNCDCEVCKREL